MIFHRAPHRRRNRGGFQKMNFGPHSFGKIIEELFLVICMDGKCKNACKKLLLLREDTNWFRAPLIFVE